MRFRDIVMWARIDNGIRKTALLKTMLVACCFVSCQVKTGDDNVVLTDFTKELISLYINDSRNTDANNRKDEIIVTTAEDTSYYYLSVFANDRKSYRYCREDLIGRTSCLGHSVKVYGENNPSFYSVLWENRKPERCKENQMTEYDPNVWEICFYKDMSFNKMRTYKTSPYEDISEIQRLAEKYFKVSQTVADEIYQSVENMPEFALGEDALRELIASNFTIRKQGDFGPVPIIVDIIVDKEGKATFREIVKISNDPELDNEAKRVAEIICQYDFIPASHRGETVKSIYSIAFLRSDIICCLLSEQVTYLVRLDNEIIEERIYKKNELQSIVAFNCSDTKDSIVFKDGIVFYHYNVDGYVREEYSPYDKFYYMDFDKSQYNNGIYDLVKSHLLVEGVLWSLAALDETLGSDNVLLSDKKTVTKNSDGWNIEYVNINSKIQLPFLFETYNDEILKSLKIYITDGLLSKLSFDGTNTRQIVEFEYDNGVLHNEYVRVSDVNNGQLISVDEFSFIKK